MTTDRECPCGTQAVRDQAALWFARSRDSDLLPSARLQFEAWLAEHDQHAHEFRLLQNLWGAVDPLSKARLQALGQRDASKRLHAACAIKRRTFAPYLLALSLVGIVVGGGLYVGSGGEPDYSAAFTTGFGERRQVALPDGSVLDLNGQTRLKVHFFGPARQVELIEGEAMFSVEHDSSRPFVVQIGNGSVTVTGTRFDIRREPERTLVAVESGAVEVEGQADGQGNKVTLTAGLGASIDVGGKVTPAVAVNTTAITAWRGGR